MRKTLGVALIVATTLVAGCSGAGDTSPVTVTVNSPISPTTEHVAESPGGPPTRSGPTARSAPSTRSTATPARPSASSTSASSRASTSRTAIPPLVQADGDLDAAGPDNGPQCPVAAQYSDEAPTGLRADVKAAWISVKKQAAAKGVRLCLNDGKRSKAQQIAIYNLYVKEYGRTTANNLVLPWQKSAHVKGYAVDVQPAKAIQWLQATKGRLGFCRIYDNETWHFEYSTHYKTYGCPARLPKP
ncbi:D-alanyl-D-alanine carboxypeptidase [Nakamurella panacisegetis]|uniref:D-alanyl-D-alanine carboxypeptidase n=1 Tax=Nakamurella panacisegetis TaxID=1090615 RepID=A0A1H0SLT4_9ACTN|nr:D-alanyl-D-alanine carboxypeptidase family protein [Nakamurella panacisegetis]SDP42693.1 D-alanyl-D-alanine carboxypeptidase [Nakamurella panacisegetis]